MVRRAGPTRCSSTPSFHRVVPKEIFPGEVFNGVIAGRLGPKDAQGNRLHVDGYYVDFEAGGRTYRGTAFANGNESLRVGQAVSVRISDAECVGRGQSLRINVSIESVITQQASQRSVAAPKRADDCTYTILEEHYIVPGGEFGSDVDGAIPVRWWKKNMKVEDNGLIIKVGGQDRVLLLPDGFYAMIQKIGIDGKVTLGVYPKRLEMRTVYELRHSAFPQASIGLATFSYPPRLEDRNSRMFSLDYMPESKTTDELVVLAGRGELPFKEYRQW